jgi:succinoglycan biosynthesis transport protein ExoP
VSTPVTVRDYLRLIFRRKYAIVMPIFCSVFLILPVWKLVPEKYKATAIVRRQELARTNAVLGLMVHENAPLPVEGLRTEILTPNNLDRVVKQLKLDVDLKSLADWQNEYVLLRSSITINANAHGGGVDYIEIAVKNKDPFLSEKIANAIADNYVEESQGKSREQTLQGIDYLKQQCDDNLAIVRKANIELDKYTRENWTELPEVKKQILATLQGLRTTEGEHLLLLSAAQNRLTEIGRQVKEVEKTIKNDIQTMDNPTRQELQSQLMQRKKRLTEMLVNYTEDHPQVKAVREEIATLEDQLKDTPERVPGTIHETINPVYQNLVQARMIAEQEVKAQEATLNETRAQIMANEASIRKVVNEEKQYADIQRQHDEAQSAYEQFHQSLLKLQNQSRVQEEPKNGTQVEIIQRALLPTAPDHSYQLPIAIACVGGAAVAGFVLTFLLEFVDHSLRGADDAVASLELPVLATLMEIPEPAPLESARRRKRLILSIAAVIVLLGVLAATLVEGFAPGSVLGKASGFVAWLKELPAELVASIKELRH